MKILVIGAHGDVGKRLVKSLTRKNHTVLAMIRDETQKTDFQTMGAETVIADLEKDIGHAYQYKLDAVIFTAGSGADTPPEKTKTVDLDGARKSIDEAVKNHVERFIMVSALGTDSGREKEGPMASYFRAKSEADQHLVQSALNYTIFRPGRLTDEPGSGSVKAAESLDSYDSVETSRDNVANAIAEAVDMPNTHKKVIEMVDGKTPIKDALAAI